MQHNSLKKKKKIESTWRKCTKNTTECSNTRVIVKINNIFSTIKYKKMVYCLSKNKSIQLFMFTHFNN